MVEEGINETDQNLEVQTKTAQLFEWSTAFDRLASVRIASGITTIQRHLFHVHEIGSSDTMFTETVSLRF